MNRKKLFVHSWGRKLFFGLSWPLSLIVGAVYLKSFILPVNVTELIYLGLSYVGHFGLMNALVYFLLFAPVTAIMPSYYITRLWSLVLILALNLLILIDAICFSTYHLHLYSYLYQFFLTEGVDYLFKDELIKILIYLGLGVLAIVIWIRGELHWRSMQARFSNPIKNWYLVLILFFSITGKVMFFYGGVDPKLATILPLDFNYPDTSATKSSNQKFYYPKEPLGCQLKNNPNIILFYVKDLNAINFTEEQMPNLFNIQKHAVVFGSHYNVNSNIDESLFSLFFSVPASYMFSAKNSQSAFITELEYRKYEIVNLDNDSSKFNEWLTNRSGDETTPFFLSFLLDQATSDVAIQSAILELQKDDLLEGSHILVVGSSNSAGPIPFFYAHPDRKAGKVEAITTHYDIFPSMMKNIWKCKNSFSAASTGVPLENPGRDWVLSTNQYSFRIQDFKNDGAMEVSDGRVNIIGNPRRELIFLALENLVKFSMP